MSPPFWANDLVSPELLGALADPSARDPLLMLGAAGVLAAIGSRSHRRRTERREDRREDADRTVRRPDNFPRLRRAWWSVRPPADRMSVAGLVLPRTGNASHALWLGPTGSGKSQSLATVRCDGKRPMLVLTPDLSDPLRERADYIWTACEGPGRVDFLLGEPTQVAERLTEVFRSGGVGAWKRAARFATAQIIRDIDASGSQRSLKRIGLGLKDMAKADKELMRVCAGWIDRFLDLADQFGNSIGVGGVDVADLLRQGKMVVLDNDIAEHPSLGADVVALGLAEAKRITNLVPGGFRLVFEEAQQLGDRIDLAVPFFLAGRRRHIAVDALAQGEDALDSAITQNARTKVYFSQEDVQLQKKAANRLGLDYRELDPAAMADFTAWVAHGKIRRLVKFPKPKRVVSRQEINGSEVQETVGGDDAGETSGRRYVVVPIERTREVLPALPPPSVMMVTYTENVYRQAGCLRWNTKKKHDRNGYGYIYDQVEEKMVLVHRWRFEQAYGPIGRDPVTGKKLTLGHRDSCFRDCSELTHLVIQTRGENSSDMHKAKKNGTSYQAVWADEDVA